MKKKVKNNSSKGDRTLDLKINSLALYLLSYQGNLAIELFAYQLLMKRCRTRGSKNERSY
eukprot:scaffold1514_cov113-Skeletonema_dohrnii-CCMP3373.AAC.3